MTTEKTNTVKEIRKPKPWRTIEQDEIEAAHALYKKHGPSNLGLIVRGMRGAGWRQFVMSDLTGRPGRGLAGLEEMYGWFDEWRQTKAAEAAAAEAARAETEQTRAVAEVVAIETKPAKAAGFPLWLQATRPDWKWRGKFQTYIYREIEKITIGRVLRLMIFMPPRHGKSELVTVLYAAWRLLLDPGLRIVISSYNQRLANRFSRRIKAVYQGSPIMDRAEYADERDLVLNAMDEWETAAGGGVKAVGAGAGITGFGANLIIIDDPIKSRAEAESTTYRDRVWEWYIDDLTTRLEPKGAVILIQTRWHEDDLAGRLLNRADAVGSKWGVVKLPELAEEKDPIGRNPGQALCHARFSRKALLKKKNEMGSYSFSALYQQHPVPAEGNTFKRAWFEGKVVEHTPPGLRWCRGYDLAVSTKTSADYTASFRCALDKRGNIYIADGFRKRIEFPDQRRYIVERIAEEKDTEHGIESALHGVAFVQELRRETRVAGRAFRSVRVDADKLTRALAWANRAEEGKVYLIRGPWIDEFLDELCAFPKGKHDDQVDAVSLAVGMIETRGGGFHTFE